MKTVITGVVVREAPHGESGKLLWVLTEDRGVVCVSATGARKITASYLKSVQLFAYSKLTVHEKNGYMTLTEAELIESFYYIRNDLVTLAFASYACDVACTAAVPEDPSMLRLLLNTLYATANAVCPIPIVKAVFELKLCCISGLAPDVMQPCSECENDSDGFDVLDKEPRCADHAKTGKGYIPLGTATKKLITFVCTADYSRMLSFRASPDVAAEFCVFCEEFIVSALEMKPKTLIFYNEISRKPL